MLKVTIKYTANNVAAPPEPDETTHNVEGEEVHVFNIKDNSAMHELAAALAIRKFLETIEL